MATVPADTFLTYDAIGNREDLLNIIYIVDPTDTIFMSSIAQNGASAILHEWQTDLYEAVDGSNAHLSGEDAVTTASIPTTRITNQTQISYKVPRVSGTQESVTSAGRPSEFAYQRMKHGVALKRDMETILLQNQAQLAGDATTARLLGAILSWIATNESVGATGVAPVGGNGTAVRTDGTQRAFTEVLLQDVLQQCWDSGGNPGTIMLGSFNKQVASGFSGNMERRSEADRETLFTAIDVYVSDFGTLNIRPSRFMRQRDCLILQMDMWAVSFLPGRNMMERDLAVTGDSQRMQILSEYTLEARNERASGIVADLDTS